MMDLIIEVMYVRDRKHLRESLRDISILISTKLHAHISPALVCVQLAFGPTNFLSNACLLFNPSKSYFSNQGLRPSKLAFQSNDQIAKSSINNSRF